MTDSPVPAAERQEFSFQAEISQLLQILSHSLYQNREIALRELLSNASDALNKLRHIQLMQPEFRDDAPLTIRLVPNAEQHTLTLVDNGIGLTHAELIENLGTIAHSGSKKFLSQLAEAPQGDLALIGQFGVGFYSAFMLADQVEVVTRSYLEETGHRWISDGSGRFSIEPAPDAPRGAQIILHLKEQCRQFTEPAQLRSTVRRYSTFVPHPILLEEDQLNAQRPIWVEPRAQVTAEQHTEFYQWLSHDVTGKPLWQIHLQSDGPIQFQSIIYCPPRNPDVLGFGRSEHGLNLCAKRILVQENCKDLLPEYLQFLYGVVDAADLPLNVSRETLQDHELIPRLRKVLVAKVFSELDRLSTDQPEEFATFNREFGANLRSGIGTDFENRERIARLMRFPSTHGDDRTATISLDSYIERCAAAQDQIYYLTGPSAASLERHPLLEVFRQRQLEVLLLTDPVDEFALVQLHRYKEHEFVSIDSGDVKFPPSTDPVETPVMASPEGLTRVLELFRGALSGSVHDVRSTSRLTDSPVCLVNPAGGMSSQLQKVLQHQMKDYPQSQRVLEVNPQAALIVRLAELSRSGTNDEFIRDCGQQLHETALLLDGMVPHPQELAARSLRFMQELAASKSSLVLG